MGWWAWLWRTDGFPNRSECLNLSPALESSIRSSDFWTFVAYTLLPLGMAYVLWKRPRLFPWSIVAGYAVFILSCGVGHYLDFKMWTWPAYHAYAVNRLITQYSSWFVLVTAPYVIYRARKFRSSEEWHDLLGQMQVQVTLKEIEMVKANRRYEETQHRVRELEADLEHAKWTNLNAEKVASLKAQLGEVLRVVDPSTMPGPG